VTGAFETISQHPCAGGTVGCFRHTSAVNRCEMRFSVFVPPQAEAGTVPVLTFLSGLTCTEETFMIKSGAQQLAAELGIMLVSPDTSPRGDGVPDDPEGAYDFGLGAGFYLNATAAPWDQNFHMYDYVTKELPELVFANFPGDANRQGISGHSMGGHGALTVGLKNPDKYRSISAFAPISHPMRCPWGQKAFSNYLGDNKSTWEAYDATELASSVSTLPGHPILIDQGMGDEFLDEQLYPDDFAAACEKRGIDLTLRKHADYDHGYYFIATFFSDHLRFHADILSA